MKKRYWKERKQKITKKEKRIIKILKLLTEGKQNDAFSRFKRQDVNELMDIGILFVNDRRYDIAIGIFDNLIRIDPENKLVWYNKGLILKEIGEFEDSLRCYEKALEITPEFSEAWFGKGIVFDRIGNLDKALQSYKKALKINPEYCEAWNNYGNVLYDIENYNEALESYNVASKLKPTLGIVSYNIG